MEDINERIHELVNSFYSTNKQFPNVVLLGDKEYHDIKKLVNMLIKKDEEYDRKIFGMKIMRVKRKTYLSVALEHGNALTLHF